MPVVGYLRWQCTYCGASSTTPKGQRPQPGSCSRKGKTKDGKTKPHSWVRL